MNKKPAFHWKLLFQLAMQNLMDPSNCAIHGLVQWPIFMLGDLASNFCINQVGNHVLTRNTVREMESAYWNFEHNISICAMRACKCQISSPIHVKKPNPFTSLNILWHKSMLATHSGSWGQLTGSSLRTFQRQLYNGGVDLTYFRQHLYSNSFGQL